MVGQLHQLNEHKFEQTSGDSEGQGRSLWGHKELDTTYPLNNSNNNKYNINSKKT